MYGNTTKGDVVKRSDCILVYGSTTKGDCCKEVRLYVCVQIDVLIIICTHAACVQIDVHICMHARVQIDWPICIYTCHTCVQMNAKCTLTIMRLEWVND